MSDRSKLKEIALQAERDLNTYHSKTGSGRDRASGHENAGVSDTAADRFPGSSIKYGEEFVLNKSLNRRIPPDEGGSADDHGW